MANTVRLGPERRRPNDQTQQPVHFDHRHRPARLQRGCGRDRRGLLVIDLERRHRRTVRGRQSRSPPGSLVQRQGASCTRRHSGTRQRRAAKLGGATRRAVSGYRPRPRHHAVRARRSAGASASRRDLGGQRNRIVRRRRRRAAARVRQPCQLAARARHCARAGARDPRGARRRPRPNRPAVADRGAAALRGRRRARARRRALAAGNHFDHPVASDEQRARRALRLSNGRVQRARGPRHRLSIRPVAVVALRCDERRDHPARRGPYAVFGKQHFPPPRRARRGPGRFVRGARRCYCAAGKELRECRACRSRRRCRANRRHRHEPAARRRHVAGCGRRSDADSRAHRSAARRRECRAHDTVAAVGRLDVVDRRRRLRAAERSERNRDADLGDKPRLLLDDGHSIVGGPRLRRDRSTELAARGHRERDRCASVTSAATRSDGASVRKTTRKRGAKWSASWPTSKSRSCKSRRRRSCTSRASK